MPLFVILIAPGFNENLEKLEITIYLTRITLPFLIFVSLSSFFGAVLNSYNRFGLPAAAPIILNIFLILTLFFANYLSDNLVIYLSYAVTASGLVQFVLLYIYTKKYFQINILLKFKINNDVKIFLKNYFQVYFLQV